ncbi:hypothetical protein DPMN_003895 [Dreissena polymorpha]|uniref:EGF-like domain-containing protein n=2 Tax=Dreissena polymorpha TaxID=45954 RepID=A0A9D4MP67_DREPO|nr:hypothetical protein DPMN_003895 [Dreissena polymorpha]
MMFSQYQTYTSSSPIAIKDPGTKCTLSADFSNEDYFDDSDITNKDSGYALCCNNANVVSNNFKLFNGKETTIMFYLKTCTGCHGVVFSYKVEENAPISLDYIDNALEISHGQQDTYKSNIKLDDNVWHFVALTWSKRLKEMNLFVFRESTGTVPKVYSMKQFKKEPFMTGGQLSLGKFQVSQAEKKWKKADSFVGCFDTLGFADAAVTVETLQGLYKQHPSTIKTYLKTTGYQYYDFDEDPYDTKGYLQNDLTTTEVNSFYDGKDSGLKLENNVPLRNCYLRTSDAPIADTGTEVNDASARKRRSTSDDIESDDSRQSIGSHSISRRAVVSYNVNTICDNIFTSTSSSSLARTCGVSAMSPTQTTSLWECYDANGDSDDIADSIESFATQCQDSLGLSFFPANQTCKEFENVFDLYPYLGESCEPECKFGQVTSSTSGCKCDTGYWGTTCSSVCPGGSLNPCNGFGTCDTTYGLCDCPISHMGSSDCTVCSSGWYGDNCQLTDNGQIPNTNGYSLVGQLGSVYTLDGITYTINTQGEILLLAISDNVIFEGKFITCYTNYSCANFLAARIGDSASGHMTITVQSQNNYNSKPMVYINNVRNTLDNTLYFKGLKVYRLDQFEIKIEVKNIGKFTIRSVGQYLNFQSELSYGYVTMTSGLLSGNASSVLSTRLYHFNRAYRNSFAICNQASNILSPLQSESAYTLSPSSFSQSYANETSFDITRHSITSCDNFIHYPNEDYKLQKQGGYILKFSDSILNKDFSLDPMYPEVTFEMVVRPETSNTSGIIFGFTSSDSFGIVIFNDSLQIHVYTNKSTTIYETNVYIDPELWNKIVFTYNSTSGSSVMYTIDDAGAISSSGEMILKANIFTESGTLSIGHWSIPSNVNQYNIGEGLKGDIENFMIWNNLIDGSQVSQLHQMNPALAEGSLIYALLFNEGEGESTTDSVNNNKIVLPKYPYKAPEWHISDVSYVETDLSHQLFAYFKNSTLETFANTQCQQGIFQQSPCTGVNNASLEFYYLKCRQAISATLDLTSGYNVVLDAYEMCISLNNQSTGSIVSYCDSISSEDKFGSSCPTTCPFGQKYDNGTCVCSSGYYGTLCDSACPGGSENPCNGHGDCLSNGTCKCYWNWAGDTSCGSCSNMVGPECTILSTTSLSKDSDKIAAVSSNGFFMTFGGQQISFIGYIGVFVLFKQTQLGVEIDVYQVNCEYGSCVAAVSLQTATNSVVIAPQGQGYAPQIYIDGQKYTMSNKSVTIGSNIRIDQSSLTEISVKATTLGSVTMTVLVQELFLQASVHAVQSVCNTAWGIFGNCSSSMSYASMTEDQINAHIVSNFRLDDSIILTALGVPSQNSPTTIGFALSFNQTSILTKPVTYPANKEFGNNDFSISLYWKPSSFGGFIISYGKDTSFTIHNSAPLKIQYGNKIVTTSTMPEQNEWNQLILTFNLTTNNIDVYHFSIESQITHGIVNLACPGIFQSGGTVMLGEYIPVLETSYRYNATPFVGLINEFSVWNTPIPHTLIYQAHMLNVKVSGFSSELSILATLTEGVGTVAFEDIYGNNLMMPKSPWTSPTWMTSDLELKNVRVVEKVRYTTNDIDPVVETLCTTFFEDTAVRSSCQHISNVIKWWYKNNCMITASISGNSSDTTMSMVDFASVCKVTGGDVSSLYDKIASLNVTLPGWLSQKCSDCAFGNSDGNGNCVCHYGYYGTKCDSVCPGGVISPCSGKGVCDTSGACQCTGRFSGASCSTCQEGWTGNDCTLLKQAGYDPLGNNSNILVAQVNLLGQVFMFDGTAIDVTDLGYFRLMMVQSLDIHLYARFAVCSSQTLLHSCLIGVVIEHQGKSYYISHEAYNSIGPSVEIMTEDSPLVLYNKLTLGNLQVNLMSQTTLQISITGSAIGIKISSISERLLVTISLTRVEWDALQSELDGIVTSCKTETSITSTLCSGVTRQTICTNQPVPANCQLPHTSETLSVYLQDSSYTNTNFMNIIEEIYISPLSKNCYEFSKGQGISVSEMSLPQTDFTLELHVKPKAKGGVLWTFDNGNDYVFLLNHDLTNQLVVHTKSKNYFTGLPLVINVWNQISVAWRNEAQIMEIYLHDNSGVATAYVIKLANIFGLPGTFTLGQAPAHLSSAVSAGDFTGLIDEVRVWDRTHNPNVIISNFRMRVDKETVNLMNNWNFNEGTGLTAYDRISNKNMMPVDVGTPPKWVKSDLDLSDNDALDVPQMTTTDKENAEALTAAKATCSNLISSFSLNSIYSSISTLSDVFEALCVQEIVSSNETTQAEVLLASMSELYTSIHNTTDSPIDSMCSDLTAISTYIGAQGANCTQCNFGTVNETGVCVCLENSWGSTCSNFCPSDNGGPACNSFGLCDQTSGQCQCHPRHYSTANTVENFWRKYLAKESIVTQAQYTCQTCSGEWTGKACEFAKVTSKSTTTVTGMVYGSYITNFLGILFIHVVPGTYVLFKTDTVDVQVLYIPCPGDNLCRKLTEMTVVTTTGSVHIQHNPDGGNLTVLLKEGSNLKESMLYPVEKTEFNIHIKWTVNPYIEIAVAGSSFVLYDSPLGLVINAHLPTSQGNTNNGLLGNSGQDWISNFRCPNEADTVTENSITLDYTGNCIRSKYQPTTSAIHDENGKEALSSGGYALYLTNNVQFEATGLTVEHGAKKLALSLWMKYESVSMKRSTSSFTLMLVDVGSSEMVFMLENDILMFEWDATYNTGLQLKPDTWYYLLWTWSSVTGEASVFVVTSTTVESADPIVGTMKQGEAVNVEELKITASTYNPVTIDCLRIWKAKKTVDAAYEDSKSYCGSTDATTDSPLMIAVLFDEGNGTEVELTTYGSDGKTVSGNMIISVTGTDLTQLWKPSSIPVDNRNSPRTLTTYSRTTNDDYNTAATICLEVVSNENLTEHCSSLPTGVIDHYLEACIREYNRIGETEAQTIMLRSLIFYCGTATETSQCNFKDYFYFCDDMPSESSGFPLWVIGVVIGIVLLIAIIIAIICFIKQKNKKKEEDEFIEVDQQYRLLNNRIRNTRFNPSRLGHSGQRETSFAGSESAWSDYGRDSRLSVDSHDSLASVGSRFFESPIMFMSDPPTSTQGSRASSPSSGFFGMFGKKAVAPTKSILVETPSDMPEHFKSKKDFSQADTKKPTYSTVSKLIGRARQEAVPESPHPTPGPVGQPVPLGTHVPRSSLFGKQVSSKESTSPTRDAASPTSRLGSFFGSDSRADVKGKTTPKPGFSPMPSTNASAPTSIFGVFGGNNSRETPKPVFGKRETSPEAPRTSLETSTRTQPTHNPIFESRETSPMSRMSVESGTRSGLDKMPSPFKQTVAIPRLPPPMNLNSRKKRDEQ